MMLTRWTSDNFIRKANYSLLLYTWIIVAISQFWHYPVQSFIDTNGYRHQGMQPPTTLEFWLDGIRPFSYPLLLRLFDDNFHVALFQTGFWFLAWALFAFVSASLLRSQLLRYAWIIVVASISLSSTIFPWNLMLLTESISASGLLFLISGLLLLLSSQLKERSPWVRTPLVLMLFIISVFWQFSRDTNAYFLLFLVCLLVIAWCFQKTPRSKILLILLLTLLLTSSFQIRAASNAKRWKLPFLNVLGQRILTVPERTNEFIAMGMPVNEKVLCFKGKWYFSCDRDSRSLDQWLDSANSDYAIWLLSHPGGSLYELIENWKDIIGTESIYYSYETYPLSVGIMNLTTPLDVWMAIFLVLVVVVWLAAGVSIIKSRTKTWVLIPWAVLAVTLPLAFICYHADADEVARHCLPVRVNIYIFGWLCLFWALDALSSRFSRSSLTLFCPQNNIT